MSKKISGEELWERLAGESSVAYEAFLLYRNMSHEPGNKKKRRLASVAEKLGKSLKLIERWSRMWGWVERARAYDNELQRISMEETRAAIRKMLKDHMTMAQALQKKAMTALLRLDDQSLTARNILDYLVQGIEIERQARLQAAGDERELKLKERALDSGLFDTALNVTIKSKEVPPDGGHEGD